MMNKINKSGITLTSLVIYVVLFTAFTIFVANVSGGLNDKLFNNRGEAINYTNLNKLQYNMYKSAIASTDVAISTAEIDYSNGDRYFWDNVKQVIYKNGGILCSNVTVFTPTSVRNVDNIKVELTVEFNKYLNVLNRNIISVVEEY